MKQELAKWCHFWYHTGCHAIEASAHLERLFRRPTLADIRWVDIVAMLQAVDVEVSQRSGSRVLLKKGAERMVVHRPHPEPDTGKATVRDIAAFLESVGEKP